MMTMRKIVALTAGALLVVLWLLFLYMSPVGAVDGLHGGGPSIWQEARCGPWKDMPLEGHIFRQFRDCRFDMSLFSIEVTQGRTSSGADATYGITASRVHWRWFRVAMATVLVVLCAGSLAVVAGWGWRFLGKREST